VGNRHDADDHHPGGPSQCLRGPFLDFRDPWGNRVEIVGYDNIQFSKAPNVLRGMGLAHLVKNAKAIKELAEKGMAPDRGLGSER
jgi:hypothetical protein